MKRGQGSVELLIALAIGLTVLVIILANSLNSLGTYKTSFNSDQIRDALTEIKTAAELVYQQGVGSKTEITIVLPVGLNSSSVSGNVISYTLSNGNIISRTVSFNVTGTLPIESGRHFIELESADGQTVLISTNTSSVV